MSKQSNQKYRKEKERELGIKTDNKSEDVSDYDKSEKDKDDDNPDITLEGPDDF